MPYVTPLGADKLHLDKALGWDYEQIPDKFTADFREHIADRGAST